MNRQQHVFLEEKYNRTFTEKQLLGNVLIYAEKKEVNDLHREQEIEIRKISHWNIILVNQYSSIKDIFK